MAQDSVTEVTNTSWFSRLGNAFRGILVGLVLFIAAFPLLAWNEGRAVRTARTLNEGSGIVESISASRVNTATNGKLVHLSGQTATANILSDDTFGVSTNAVKLRRIVEMYQWKESSSSETRTKVGGGQETVTTYNYETTWAPGVINSANFNTAAGHQNPTSIPFEDSSLVAADVSLEAYQLSDSQINKMSSFEPLPLSAEHITAIDNAYDASVSVEASNGGVYLGFAGFNAGNPQVGDVRIRFEHVPAGEVSIVAQQQGDSFQAYQSKHGGTINMLRAGVVSAEDMFEAAEQSNRALTWGLRVAGFFIMMIGLRMVFAPLAVFADVLPFLGNIMRLGTGAIAGVIAFAFTLITIAIAWFAYRPIISIPLLVIALAGIIAAWTMGKNRQASQAPVTEGAEAIS